jgi:hypothetical protein
VLPSTWSAVLEVPMMIRSRSIARALTVLIAVTLLSACGNDADDDVADDDVADDDTPGVEAPGEDSMPGFGDPAPELDPATGSVDLASGEEMPVARVGEDGAETYVAEVDGDLFVALVVTGDDETGPEVLAYACDGAEISAWFTSDLETEGPAPTPGQETELTLSRLDDVASGTLRLEGRDHEFTATLAGGDAGLYRGETDLDGAPIIGGWIVLDDDRQRGAITLATGSGAGKVSFQ